MSMPGNVQVKKANTPRLSHKRSNIRITLSLGQTEQVHQTSARRKQANGKFSTRNTSVSD